MRNELKGIARGAAAFALVVILVSALSSYGSPLPKEFADPELGFRYTPPADLRDSTLADNQSIAERSKAAGNASHITLLLSMTSSARILPRTGALLRFKPIPARSTKH